MRYGLRSQRAPLDCTSSRRSTVMRALPRATGVTTGYQRDSSSKRPMSSVVSAARPPTRRTRVGHGVQGFAPARHACGAPGHRAHHVVEALVRNKLTLAGDAQAPAIDRGLDGESHSISDRRQQQRDAAERREHPAEQPVTPEAELADPPSCAPGRRAARGSEAGSARARRRDARRIARDADRQTGVERRRNAYGT